MKTTVRRRIADWMRNKAGRVDPTSGPRAIGAHFNFVPGQGLVLTKTDGIPIHPPAPGCPLWYMAEDYDRAFADEDVQTRRLNRE
ncbi:hypothetical protein ACUNCS_08060 [Rhodococcus erythropolis]